MQGSGAEMGSEGEEGFRMEIGNADAAILPVRSSSAARSRSSSAEFWHSSVYRNYDAVATSRDGGSGDGNTGSDSSSAMLDACGGPLRSEGGGA